MSKLIQPPEHIGSVIERWKQRQEELTTLDASVKAAPLIGEMLADLETIAVSRDEELNLTQAAERSGYSADHIGRMVRDGKLHNYGRKGSPRVRRSELPMRAKVALPGSSRGGYDVRADARQSLGVRR